MRLLPAAAVGLLLFAVPLRGGGAKDCADLSAKIDNDVSSPSGVRVTIWGRNRCQENVDASEWRFKVKALGAANAVVGIQRGNFGGMVAPRAQIETKVFVECDPDLVKSVRVEAE